MYVIIVCATLPTLRASYSVVVNSRKGTAYTRTESRSRQKAIPLKRRTMDASLFATTVNEEPAARNSSQERILDNTGIHKTTEVHVIQEAPEESSSNPHFPQPNPFRRPA